MAVPSEVARIEAAIKNKGAKELEWSLWYCRMRQTTPSARPADVKYWSAAEEAVLEAMAPAVEGRAYPKKKKRADRGLGASDPAGAPAVGGTDEPV